MNAWRRIGLSRAIALAGILLLFAGFALTVGESQTRLNAATAAVALSPTQLEQLRRVGVENINQDAYRDWLILTSMTSGGRVPTLVLDVSDDEDSGFWSWAPVDNQSAASIGGWQPKPLTVVSAAGLTLVLVSLFLAASRWRPRPSLTRPADAPN